VHSADACGARPAWGAEGSLGQRPNVPEAERCLKKNKNTYRLQID